jgi:hypothetical protein
MDILFQAQGYEGFLILVKDYPIGQLGKETNRFIDRLVSWLHKERPDIYWDIEFHEGGTVTIDESEDDKEIRFRGDNGIFTLTEVEVNSL